MKKIGLFVAALGVMSAPLSAKTVEERLDELELSRDSQVLKLGGRFISRYDNFSAETRSSSSATYKTKSYNVYRMQFSMNLDADITQKLKFYGRYTTSKYWNHYQRSETASGSTSGTSYDVSSGRDLGIGDNFDGGPTTFLERAYLNYFATDYLAFSVGRLPTVEGPPLNWEDGISREGTYAHLAYSNILDGVATTFNFSKFMPEKHSASLRLIYTPFSNNAGVDSKIAVNGVDLKEDTPVMTVMGEYSHKGSFYKEFLVLGQFLNIDNLYFTRSSTAFSAVHYQTASLYLGLTDIASLGLDFSATYFASSIQNNYFNGTTGLFANSGDYEAKKGNSFLLATKYMLPVSMLNNPSLGVEYIQGSKHYYKSDSVSHDATGFYTTRGNGVHAYYLQPIEGGLKLRVGYVNKVDDYARGAAALFGAQTSSRKVENKFNAVYANVRLDF